MNIVFFGSDDFAATHLAALVESRHKVCRCVTPPDKARGRGMRVLACPVKELAAQQGIPVLQPTDLNADSFLKNLKDCAADLFVVIAYGRFLPKAVLALPRTFAINVHGSLLPKYRGAAPINWAIINGESETGLSIQQVTGKMDAGDVLAREKIPIQDNDTAVSLRSRMAHLGPQLLLRTIDAVEKGTYTLIAQDDNAVTFAPKLTKELGHIRWDKSAAVIHNLVRGLLPWPTAYTRYQGKLLKILETEVVPGHFSSAGPGEVAGVDKKGFTVATADCGLLVKKVHLEASRPMSAYEFVVGHKLETGFTFHL